MAILICTIGGHDLTCIDLPKDGRGERGWAEEVLVRYNELRPLLRLPIIGKVLAHLHAQGLAADSVVLIASRQQPSATGTPFWENDTFYTAAVITRLLTEGFSDYTPIPAYRINTWIIADESGVGDDPSDYDLVLGFLERRLALLATITPRGMVFLKVTGGTPAITTRLLIAGTEAFGPHVMIV